MRRSLNPCKAGLGFKPVGEPTSEPILAVGESTVSQRVSLEPLQNKSGESGEPIFQLAEKFRNILANFNEDERMRFIEAVGLEKLTHLAHHADIARDTGSPAASPIDSPASPIDSPAASPTETKIIVGATVAHSDPYTVAYSYHGIVESVNKNEAYVRWAQCQGKPSERETYNLSELRLLEPPTS